MRRCELCQWVGQGREGHQVGGLWCRSKWVIRLVFEGLPKPFGVLPDGLFGLLMV